MSPIKDNNAPADEILSCQRTSFRVDIPDDETCFAIVDQSFSATGFRVLFIILHLNSFPTSFLA